MGIRGQLRTAARDERGITGLETAIILIAFVVVASVFAYTVLTAGIFGSEKSKEAIHASIREVRSTSVLKGGTLAYANPVDIDGVATSTADRVTAVTKVDLIVGIALQGEAIDVTPAYRLNAASGYLESSGVTNSLVITYIDDNQVITDMAWTVTFPGSSDGDFSLELTEKAIISVWLQDYEYSTALGANYYRLGTNTSDPFIDTSANLLGRFDVFSIELSPIQGAPLLVEKVAPQALNPIMNLR